MSTPNSFRISGQAPSNIMTDTEREALQRLASSVFRRGRRAWEAPGLPGIAFHTAAMLKQKNAAVIQHGTGKDKLKITPIGREVVDLVQSARKRRAVAKARADRKEASQ